MRIIADLLFEVFFGGAGGGPLGTLLLIVIAISLMTVAVVLVRSPNHGRRSARELHVLLSTPTATWSWTVQAPQGQTHAELLTRLRADLPDGQADAPITYLTMTPSIVGPTGRRLGRRAAQIVDGPTCLTAPATATPTGTPTGTAPSPAASTTSRRPTVPSQAGTAARRPVAAASLSRTHAGES